MIESARNSGVFSAKFFYPDLVQVSWDRIKCQDTGTGVLKFVLCVLMAGEDQSQSMGQESFLGRHRAPGREQSQSEGIVQWHRLVLLSGLKGRWPMVVKRHITRLRNTHQCMWDRERDYRSLQAAPLNKTVEEMSPHLYNGHYPHPTLVERIKRDHACNKPITILCVF